MVRFVKSVLEGFRSSHESNRFVYVERAIAILYIPATSCIALSSLGKSGIMPYMSPHEWSLLLAASLFLTITNARDLNICARHILMPIERTSELSPSCRYAVGQMELGSTLALSLGSLSLFNASVIQLLNIAENNLESCYRQYALSFGLFAIGTAANTAPLSKELAANENSRALLAFQHIISSMFFSVAGLLMIPSLFQSDNLELRKTLVASLSVMGSIALVFASVVNLFHVDGILHSYQRYREGLHGLGLTSSRRKKKKKKQRHGIMGRLLKVLHSHPQKTTVDTSKVENYQTNAQSVSVDETNSLLTIDCFSTSLPSSASFSEVEHADVENGGLVKNANSLRSPSGHRSRKSKRDMWG